MSSKTSSKSSSKRDSKGKKIKTIEKSVNVHEEYDLICDQAGELEAGEDGADHL